MSTTSKKFGDDGSDSYRKQTASVLHKTPYRRCNIICVDKRRLAYAIYIRAAFYRGICNLARAFRRHRAILTVSSFCLPTGTFPA